MHSCIHCRDGSQCGYFNHMAQQPLLAQLYGWWAHGFGRCCDTLHLFYVISSPNPSKMRRKQDKSLIFTLCIKSISVAQAQAKFCTCYCMQTHDDSGSHAAEDTFYQDQSSTCREHMHAEQNATKLMESRVNPRLPSFRGAAKRARTRE